MMTVNNEIQKEKKTIIISSATWLKIGGLVVFLIGLIVLALLIKPPTNVNDGQKTQHRSISFDLLSDFEYYVPLPGEVPDHEKLAQNKIPYEVKQLNGEKISISGYMLPVEVDNDGNVKEFVLNGSYDMCYYGAPTSINQWVYVKMEEGKKAKFTHNQILVYGTFEVGEEQKDGSLLSLYRLKSNAVNSGKLVY